MLGELHIQNFAVIEDVKMTLAPGLTILSGEEGAGKSLVVDAISILLGARAPAGLIRNGAPTARVEGVFWLSTDTVERLNSLLQESAIEPEGDGMLVISREIQQQGRSISRVNSRAVPLSLLRQIGQHLVDMHGQMDYISLLDVHRQLDLLDAFGNLGELRNHLAYSVENLRQKLHELASLNTEKTIGRQELLRYQVEEIERANLKPGEDQSFQNRREVLLRSEALRECCLKAYGSLYGEERSATVLIHEAIIALKGLHDSNLAMPSYGEQLDLAMTNLEEIARDLRHYGDTIETDVSQLEEVEQRLNLISSLKRKYGATIEDMINFQTKAKAELEAIDNHQERKTYLEKEQEHLKSELGKQAEELSLSRRRAAKSLAGLVNEELADLGLPWSKFDVRLSREEDTKGLPTAGGKHFAFTRDGIDRVEFFVATNPGEPMRPLAAIASGGETCRVMLALKSALNRVDPVPILVFDEIDGGIGGRSGDTVGMKLATIAQQHQVLCITHLPQVACFGDAHIRLIKDTSSGRAYTRVEAVMGQARIEELAAMLGSENTGNVMFDGAGKLLDKAQARKKQEKDIIAA